MDSVLLFDIWQRAYYHWLVMVKAGTPELERECQRAHADFLLQALGSALTAKSAKSILCGTVNSQAK